MEGITWQTTREEGSRQSWATGSYASNETKIMILSSGKWGWRFCRPKTTGSYKHRCAVSQANIKLAQDTYTQSRRACSVLFGSYRQNSFLSLSSGKSHSYISFSVFSFSVFSHCTLFVLGVIHFKCLSNSSTVIPALSVNLSEPQWRRPLPGLNSKENKTFPKLGRPVKSESEDGESEKEKRGK